MNKKLIFRYITIFVIVVETFQFISGYVNIPDIALFFGTIFASIILYPKAFLNKSTLWFFIFEAIVFINVILKGFDFKWFFLLFMYWFFALSLLNVFLSNKDIKGLRMIMIASLIVLVVTTIFTIPQLIINPDIVRDMAIATNEHDMGMAQIGQRMGLINYGLLHSIPPLFPVLIFNIRNTNSKKSKLLWLCLICLLYFLILKSSFGTILILSTIIIPISLLMTGKKKKDIIIIFSFLIILLPILNKNTMISGLESIKYVFMETPVFDKINDIQKSIDVGDNEGQLSNRNNLYSDSWNAFSKNPIFGTSNDNQVGQHAFIADFAAWFGLIGVIPLITFFVTTFKRQYRRFDPKMRTYYLLALFPFIILCILKGTPSFEPMLYILFIMPLVFQEENRKKIEIKLVKNS